MTYFASTMTGVALSAGFIFLLLRIFSSNSHQNNRARNISSHAFWTAVIAFFASGVNGLSNLWALPSFTTYGESNWENRVMHAAAPGLWLGIIYLIGQFTWPRHLQPVRSASLEVRSAKALIPTYLAGLLLIVTLLSSVAIGFAWNDAGAAHRTGIDQSSSYISDYETDDFGNPVDEQGNPIDPSRFDEDGYLIVEADQEYVSNIDGARPGDQVGPYLAGGLALMMLSVVAVTATVAHRPPLQTLSTEENDILRRIWINRLLRTAIIVSAGFGSMALQYMGQAASDRATWAVAQDPDTSYQFSDSGLSVNWLLGSGSLWMVVIVLAMAFWAPPRLPHELSDTPRTDAPNSASYSKARDFLLLIQGTLLVAIVIAGVMPSWSTTSSETSQVWQVTEVDGETVEELVHSSGPQFLDELPGATFTLAVMVGAYLLLHLLGNYVIRRRLGDSTPVDVPFKNLLPRWFLIVVALAVGTGLVFTASYLLSAPSENKQAADWALALLAVTALLAWLLYRAAARREALKGASAYEDFQIRVIIAHRGARIFAGTSLFVAAMMSSSNLWTPNRYADYMDTYNSMGPSGVQVALITVGLTLCFLPASTATIPASFGQQPADRQHT
ncbi:hypothetical protein CQ018_02355 [Arthrobacter sp. MYb227]|uniref:hypothetical protein n=1 Tax=Arthrobacter sp. MYb227 TaxID=1848601 RepID=UPI000CFA9DDE|nr:hypothetical protein [Arthrobacter sp. MYb227]PQZ96144.1 hypothetical protein CQ018_02355 [Arthrobacter sp. MYb227]